jgi:hypothetical protein
MPHTRLGPSLIPQGIVSRDSAAMEATSAWMTHTYLGRTTTESGIRQSENNTLNGCIPLCPNSVNKNPPASTVIGHVLCTVCLTHTSIIFTYFLSGK